jgi:hypothetical protein
MMNVIKSIMVFLLRFKMNIDAWLDPRAYRVASISNENFSDHGI